MSAGPQALPFPRRPHDDGTFDSICPRCYRTIATGTPQAVSLEEERHECQGVASLYSLWIDAPAADATAEEKNGIPRP